MTRLSVATNPLVEIPSHVVSEVRYVPLSLTLFLENRKEYRILFLRSVLQTYLTERM